jgi:hypothetical protein
VILSRLRRVKREQQICAWAGLLLLLSSAVVAVLAVMRCDLLAFVVQSCLVELDSEVTPQWQIGDSAKLHRLVTYLILLCLNHTLVEQAA